MRITTISLVLALLAVVATSALATTGGGFTAAVATPALLDLLVRCSVLVLAGGVLMAGALYRSA